MLPYRDYAPTTSRSLKAASTMCMALAGSGVGHAPCKLLAAWIPSKNEDVWSMAQAHRGRAEERGGLRPKCFKIKQFSKQKCGFNKPGFPVY